MDIRNSGLADHGGGSHLQEEGPEGVLSNIPLFIVGYIVGYYNIYWVFFSTFTQTLSAYSASL